MGRLVVFGLFSQCKFYVLLKKSVLITKQLFTTQLNSNLYSANCSHFKSNFFRNVQRRFNAMLTWTSYSITLAPSIEWNCYSPGMTLNSSVVKNYSIWQQHEIIFWAWLKFTLPRLIFLVWSYPIYRVASLRNMGWWAAGASFEGGRGCRPQGIRKKKKERTKKKKRKKKKKRRKKKERRELWITSNYYI